MKKVIESIYIENLEEALIICEDDTYYIYYGAGFHQHWNWKHKISETKTDSSILNEHVQTQKYGIKDNNLYKFDKITHDWKLDILLRRGTIKKIDNITSYLHYII